MKVICFNSAAFKTYYTFMLINDYVYFLIFLFVCFVNCYIFCYSYVMFSPNILTWKNCQFTYFQIFDQRGVYSRGSYLVRSYSKLSINFTHTLHKHALKRHQNGLKEKCLNHTTPSGLKCLNPCHAI